MSRCKLPYKKRILASVLLFVLLFPLVSSMSGLSNLAAIDTPLDMNVNNDGITASPSIVAPTMPISSRGLKATGAIAILEDVDPWLFNDVETILLTHSNMVVDTIASAAFGTWLGKYQKVIISSQQYPSFYTAVETYRSWLENYVLGGGTLEIHAARLSSQGDWILPGGFGYIVNLTSNVEFVDIDHYLLHNPFEANETELDGWNYSAHGYLNNTQGASVIITDGAGEPVLIETRYGAGYIIVTTQTVEYISGNGYSDFLENMAWYVPTHESPPDGALTGPVAILQDINPWSYDSIQQILTNLGVSFDIIPSVDFGTTPLSSYQKVIIASVQDPAFYSALATHRTWLENYVNNGGILEVHATTQGTEWILPGGAGYNYNLTNNINILTPFHPLLYRPYRILEPELEYWNQATHGYFNDTTGATLILNDGLEAVCFENASGNGFIIATAQTVEYSWWIDKNYSMFLENLIQYIPHHQVQLQPGDYIDTYLDSVSGNYDEYNFTFGTYLDDWQINMTKSIQRFYANDTMYGDSLYWLSLQTRTRRFEAGTSPWIFSYFIFLIPTAGLTIGSIIPIWNGAGIILGEVNHIWVNGITYDCWNVSWMDGPTLTYSYFEKTSGVSLYSFNTNYPYEIHTVASNLIPQPPEVTVAYPNGGEAINSTITITWTAFDPNDDSLTFDLEYWNGTSWASLATGLTTMSYLWDTTSVPNGADYRVRVTAHDGTYSTADESNGTFTINNPIISPLPWWWWIAALAVIIVIVIIIVIFLVMKRRGASK